RVANLEPHDSSLGKLDGVVRQVEQYLAERPPVGFQQHVLQQHAQLERKALGFGQRTKRGDHFIDDALTRDRLSIDLDFSRLDLRQVKKVINKGQEVSCARADCLELMVLIRRQRARQSHQERACKPNDRVQ